MTARASFRGFVAHLRAEGLRALGFERALIIAFAGRAWQSLAGLATLFFIIEFFSPETQGYHQTFLSLLSLQTFLELGILNVLVSVISHEWAGLELRADRRIDGKPEKLDRLASATRFTVVWFVGAASLFFILGGSVGSIVLRQHGQVAFWAAPWVATIALGSVLLWFNGLIAVIEGCNQILAVAKYRLAAVVASALSLWAAVVSGMNLWSLAISLGAQVLCAALFVGVRYRAFYTQLIFKPGQSSFNWKTDVWPMQWPLAIQGVAAYFMFALFVPVMFSYFGPVEAGRMGLSLQVVIALAAIGTTWMSIQAPRMGTMFASGDYQAYEVTWLRATVLSMGALICGAGLITAAVWLAAGMDMPVSNRFLEPLPFTLLLAWGLTYHVAQCCTAYWRAQRIELMRLTGILPGGITGLAVWQLGMHFGAIGATAGAFATAVAVTVPLCLKYFRDAHGRTAALLAA